MAIFTKQFANADHYEELHAAGGRITVLAITKAPTPLGSTQPAAGAVTVRYQTNDRELAPAKSMTTMIAEVVVIGELFFALFLYLISKI